MANNKDTILCIQRKFKALKSVMDERTRRLWAAIEAQEIGYGGQRIVSEATGLSRRTIYSGLHELESPKKVSHILEKTRKKGGGRKLLIETDPLLISDLEELVEPTNRGEPENPLRWTCKSTRHLAKELQDKGHEIGYKKVAELLKQQGYSLQGLRKTKEGSSPPDRNAQFEYINKQIKRYQKKGFPVISVDAKKKEQVGDFYNKGKEWQPKGTPEKVRVYDFIDKKLGKVNPYGVYDQIANEGLVNVGIDHDTAEFAVESIKLWWKKMGQQRYPNATKLLITADGGGSNGSRNRLWKIKLQDFVNEYGVNISVCHFPPGTSKWNKIEHRMFSYISMNWKGRSLMSLETIVNLISNTTTKKGLKVEAEIDTAPYLTGIKVSDKELEAINLKKATFHGEWNYSICTIK